MSWLPTNILFVCKHWILVCQKTQHNLNCLVRPCFLHSTQIIIPDTYPDGRTLPRVVSSLHTSVTHPEINTPSFAKTIASSWPPPVPGPHYLPTIYSIPATWMNISGCNKSYIITCVHFPWSNFKTFKSDCAIPSAMISTNSPVRLFLLSQEAFVFIAVSVRLIWSVTASVVHQQRSILYSFVILHKDDVVVRKWWLVSEDFLFASWWTPYNMMVCYHLVR